MQPDQTTFLSRARGTLPDRYWYQFEGMPVEQKLMEQRAKIYENLTTQADEGGGELHITSEVKVK